jgi:hypothetical protein
VNAFLLTVLSAIIVLMLVGAILRDGGRHAEQGALVAFVVAAFLFLIRLPLTGAVALVIGVLGLVHSARRPVKRGRRRRKSWSRVHSRPQRSTVRTAVLEMVLDAGSGAITGRIIAGPHAGSALDDLSVEQLLEVAASLDENDSQSLSLLSTYLDRVHPGWADTAEGGAAGDGAAPLGNPGAMTREQAYEVLGLEPGASPDEVLAAHRRLIKRVHPDAGGSAALAAHINAAKARLL